VPISRTFAYDGAIALALAMTLGVVFLIDRTRAPAATPVPVVPTPVAAAPAAPRLKLAVTPHQYDDMGKLLDQLGEGFSYTNLPLEALEDTVKLVDYDVIFLTCGTDPTHWVTGGDLGTGERPGVRRAKYNEQVLDKVREALRAFVGRGGTLYASDWRLNVIHYSFPELFDGEDIVDGAAQTLVADVVDDGLRDVVGSKVELKFDLPGWKPARFDPGKATIYLRGEYRARADVPTIAAPLLVKIPFEQGTIIFTSFHNEKVNSELETKLLKFLVFAAVTARETAEAKNIMISGGFSPQKQNLLSASPEAAPVQNVYTNAKRGRLRFVLSFANRGAELALSVRGPDGKTHEQQGASTFTVDVADAAIGEWTYTVTARKVPYANFPFTLSVGGD
jgi:hypothetical protein